MADPIPKILKIILAVVVLLILFFWHLNSSYVADVFVCKTTNLECNESEASAAKASYDSMDGLYYIHELYTNSGTVKLKDFCVVREAENYGAVCEDENGNSWDITLIELRR